MNFITILPWFLKLMLMPLFMSFADPVKGGGSDEGDITEPDPSGSSGGDGAISVEQLIGSLDKVPEADRGSYYHKLLDKLEPSSVSSEEYRRFLASLTPEQRSAQRMSHSREMQARLKKMQAPGDYSAKEAEWKQKLEANSKIIEELKAQLQKNAPEIELPPEFDKYDDATKTMAKQLLVGISKQFQGLQEEISRLRQPFEEDAHRQELARIVEDKNKIASFLPDSNIQTLAVLDSSLPEDQRHDITELIEQALVQFYDGVTGALEANDPGVLEKLMAWYPKAMESQKPLAQKLTRTVLQYYTANQDKLKDLGKENSPSQPAGGKSKEEGPKDSREARYQIAKGISDIVADVKAKLGGNAET